MATTAATVASMETAVASMEAAVASMEVAAEVTAAGEVRDELRWMTARGWAGCYYACGPLYEGEGGR